MFHAVDHDGIERLSIDRVKDIAELSRGTFYNYAETLDDMLSKVSYLTWRQVNSEQQALFGEIKDPLERLTNYLRYGVARTASDKACTQIMVRSLPITGVFSAEMWQRLTIAFGLAAAEGSIDVVSVDVAVDISMGSVLVMLRHAAQRGLDPTALEQQALMLLRGLGARKARAIALLKRPPPAQPSTSLRTKVLDAGWD